jgi:hypothetical protein
MVPINNVHAQAAFAAAAPQGRMTDVERLRHQYNQLEAQHRALLTAVAAQPVPQPPAPTAQPATTKVLIELLHARTESPPCNADGTYTVGNCRPDALCQEAATEIERLCAAVALFTDIRSKQMLTDHGIAQAMNFRSLNGGNDDSPWWLLFARDIERLTRQHCALERMTEDAQRLGITAAPAAKGAST